MKSHINILALLIATIVLRSTNSAKISSSHQLRDEHGTELFYQNQTIEENSLDSKPLSWNFSINVQDFTDLKKLQLTPQICDPSIVYIINDIEDLRSNIPVLECIFRKAMAPYGIPVGPYTGAVIQLTSTTIFNEKAQYFWKGKTIQSTACKGNTALTGWNNIKNYRLVPFIAYEAIFKGALHSSEFNDGRFSLILDYTVNFASVCPEFGSTPDNIYPINQIIDLVRLVGRGSDGGLIHLGKTLFRTDRNSPFFNIAWFSLTFYTGP